jgi:hypothetical protein
MYLKIVRYSLSDELSLGEFAYLFDCTFFRLIFLQDVGKGRKQERRLCLTAKALHRITMRGFLVGATEPEKYTLKRVQLRISG